MKILFVCRHNRFRSKVAEAIFNKINKNPEIKVESAGVAIDELRSYIAENVIKVMKEKGYEIIGIPKRIDIQTINNYDLLVIVADNVNEDFFKDFRGKIIKWEIPDCDESEVDKIREFVNKIEIKIKELID